MDKNKFETKLNGSKLELQVGTLAEQASGSCLVRFGDTSVLVTAQIGRERPEMGFFPLTCEFEERHYAAGKILGSRFIRREGRPTTEATLSARMIDRTIRPLFPEGLSNEIQVIATCLSWDSENDPDIFGILGASLALSVSEIPWAGPIGVVRVGKIKDKFILNPAYEAREQSEIDVVLCGHKHQGEVVVNMIDGGAKQVDEKTMAEVFDFAVPRIKELIDFQAGIISKLGKKKVLIQAPAVEKKLENDIKKILAKKLEKALYIKKRHDRKTALADLQDEIKQLTIGDYGEDAVKYALAVFDKQVGEVIKKNILDVATGKEKRPDNRKLDDVREISVEVGILPRTHGTGLFKRGETKVLSILTLGSPGDQLLQETMEISGKKRFMHHYNFPPYSVGEIKRLGWPGRREVGHGMLAEKALLPLLPSFDDFPYTIRVVSEVVSSNGSSSMASVSAACLALMDAGVPISGPAAGIAIGLIRAPASPTSPTTPKWKLLTDIQGAEDHQGEMDFKVAGTEKGITAIQMDVKGNGITKPIFQDALEKAKKARLAILTSQNKVLAQPRKELSQFAPRIYTLQINPDKIGMVIGGGGKTINGIIDEYDVAIDIEDDGRVFVSAEKEINAQKAIDRIKAITKEFKLGEIIERGVVKSITDFGAFVEIAPGQDGLVHISQLAPFHVAKVDDVVKQGDKIPVKVIGIDEQGKISLSAKDAGFKGLSRPQPFRKKGLVR